MSDLKARIVSRVRDCYDEELHEKLGDLRHFRSEALPQLREGASGKVEIDPNSFLSVMRGRGRVAGDRANQLSIELAAEISQFGEDEARISDWLFKHCDTVLDEIEWGKQLDQELDLTRRRTIFLVILAVASLGAVLSYFPLRTYFPSSLLRALLLSGGLFLLFLWLPLEIWKRLKVAKAKRRGQMHREILKLFKESQALIDAGSPQAAREKAEAGFSLATRVVGGVNWGYCFNVLGRALIGSNRNEESLGYLQEAFEISRISNDNTAEFSALFGIGEFHLAKGDRERAMTAFRSALEVAQRDNYPEFLERAEKKLAML